MSNTKILEVKGYGTIELTVTANKYYQSDDYHVSSINLKFTDINGNIADCHLLSTQQVKLIKDYFDELYDDMEKHI